MPTPVLEQIASTLATRLATTANVVEVVRPKRREPYTPQHLQIVIEQADPERDLELSLPGNPPATAWRQRFDIQCHVIASENDITAVDQLINTFAADAVKAITNATAWHTFGGYAINSQFDSQEQIDDETVQGINIPLVVTYRTNENDPYTVR